MWTVLVGIAWSACPAGPEVIEAELEHARVAFAAMDREGLLSATGRVESLLACLGEPVTQALVVRIHATLGYAAFVKGDTDRAARAFAAARSLDPGWGPDPGIIPRGHPIRELSERLDPATLRSTPLAPPASGQLYFDGRAGVSRPADTPTVSWWLVGGHLDSAGYLWPDTPMIPYDARAVTSLPTPPVRGERRGAPWGWLAVAGGGAAMSGLSFALAADARGDWERTRTPAEADAAIDRNHGWWVAGASFAGLALAGGVGAVVSLAW